MPQHKDKKEKKTTISQNKKNKTKKKSLKKKLHPKKKPPARSTKTTYYKKYVKPSVQSYPTPIPTHHNFIKIDANTKDNNIINSTKNASSFSFSSSTSSISSTQSSSSFFIPYSTPTPTSKNNLTVASDTRHLDSPDTTHLNNTALAAAGGSASTPNAVHNTNQTMQIAGSIIGIFGGIAFISALVFIAARYKKRQRPAKEITKDMDKGYYGGSSFENNDDSDSDENTRTKKLYHSENIASYNSKPSDLVSINKPDQKSNEHDLQRRPSFTDTLVDSQTASRPNSVALKAAAAAATAADASQKQASQNGTRVSWQSVSSSLLSETISPTSTLIGTTTTSFMKTAERQLLHHERPSILDHFDGQFKKNIETYKAQLADISNPLGRIDEQEGQLNDDI